MEINKLDPILPPSSLPGDHGGEILFQHIVHFLVLDSWRQFGETVKTLSKKSRAEHENQAKRHAEMEGQRRLAEYRLSGLRHI